MPSELTIAQAAKILDCREGLILSLIEDGDITSRIVNGKLMVVRDSFLAYKQDQDRRNAAVAEMVRWDQEMGLYDVEFDVDVSNKKHGTDNKGVEMVEYTVPGPPIISQEEIEKIKRRVNDHVPMNTPEEIEKNCQELLKILLNCPVMTDEELKGFAEARREINECRLAYL